MFSWFTPKNWRLVLGKSKTENLELWEMKHNWGWRALSENRVLSGSSWLFFSTGPLPRGQPSSPSRQKTIEDPFLETQQLKGKGWKTLSLGFPRQSKSLTLRASHQLLTASFFLITDTSHPGKPLTLKTRDHDKQTLTKGWKILPRKFNSKRQNNWKIEKVVVVLN